MLAVLLALSTAHALTAAEVETLIDRAVAPAIIGATMRHAETCWTEADLRHLESVGLHRKAVRRARKNLCSEAPATGTSAPLEPRRPRRTHRLPRFRR